MADNAVRFASDAQAVGRCAYDAVQNMTGVQVNILQRLAEVQQGLLNQTLEAANDQLQLIGQTRDPRQFAVAQAELVKSHGQRYVDTVKRTVDIVAEGWEAYGDRLEKGITVATGKAQRTASTKKAA